MVISLHFLYIDIARLHLFFCRVWRGAHSAGGFKGNLPEAPGFSGAFFDSIMRVCEVVDECRRQIYLSTFPKNQGFI